MTLCKATLFMLIFCALSAAPVLSNPWQGQGSEAKKHFDRANDFYYANDPRAEQEYRTAIEKSGGYYPEAWRKLALYLSLQSRFSEAASALESLVKQSSGRSRREYLEELKDMREAAELEKRINRSAPPALVDLLKFTTLISQYGGAHGSKKAAPFAERAVILYPTSSEAHILLARMLIGADQDERRYALLQKAIELDTSNVKAHVDLGWYMLSALQPEAAIQSFNKALEISRKQDVGAWQGLGEAYSMLGLNEDATKAYRTCLRIGKLSGPNRLYIERQIEKLRKITSQ